MSDDGRAPVTVVVPTVGRVEPLTRCLESLAACAPRPAEVVVSDQSHSAEIAALVTSFASVGARVVRSEGRGVSRARNDGLRAAQHEIVLITDDDCTVEPDWVALGAAVVSTAEPQRIVTGRVLHVGDPRGLTDAVEDLEPRDYTGTPTTGVLFPNNVALVRSAVLGAEGGFDERFGPDEAAEDNEFCYRWLKAGHRIVYDPRLVVFHHHWREPAELERLHVRYARGEGFLYAKHLRRGDLRMLRFVARDLSWGLRGLLVGVVRRRPRWTDYRRGILRGLPGGFRDGWRTFGGRR